MRLTFKQFLLQESYQTDLQDEIWHIFRKKMTAEQQREFLESEDIKFEDIWEMDVDSLEYILDTLSKLVTL